MDFYDFTDRKSYFDDFTYYLYMITYINDNNNHYKLRNYCYHLIKNDHSFILINRNMTIDINKKYKNGNTIVMLAIPYQCPYIIKKWCNHKYNVNIKNDDGNTVFHEAVKYKNNQIIKILLNHGADFTIKNKKNENVLDIFLQNKENSKKSYLYKFIFSYKKYRYKYLYYLSKINKKLYNNYDILRHITEYF